MKDIDPIFLARRLAAAALAVSLSGCAGLSLNADFYGSYRSDIIPGTYGVDAKPAPRQPAAQAPAAAL